MGSDVLDSNRDLAYHRNVVVTGTVVEHADNVIINQQFKDNSITNIISTVDQLPLSSKRKREAKSMIMEYENESAKPYPDKGKLRNIINKIGGISKEVGIMLLQNALDKGVIPWPTLT